MAEQEPWKRPKNFEDLVEDRADLVIEESELEDERDAFIAGALWAALLAEGRIDG